MCYRIAALYFTFIASVACDTAVESDSDCVAWADGCNDCVQMCTPASTVPNDLCEVECEESLPACIENEGVCAFSD
ncbi:MAG: hypothetical protein HN348_04135 [Proteobacteria bacterium]|jgi:hypothetical protein|nr:hypothetical protein [Pseudomonadota bacterium]